MRDNPSSNGEEVVVHLANFCGWNCGVDDLVHDLVIDLACCLRAEV